MSAAAGANCHEAQCHHRQDWPQELARCESKGITGKLIATTIEPRLCEDCMERCWYELVSEGCMAVHYNLGVCTFFSSVDTFTEANSTSTVVIRQSNVPGISKTT